MPCSFQFVLRLLVPLLCCPFQWHLDVIVKFVISPSIIPLNPLVPMHPLQEILPVSPPPPREGGCWLEFNSSGYRVSFSCLLLHLCQWLSLLPVECAFSRAPESFSRSQVPRIPRNTNRPARLGSAPHSFGLLPLLFKSNNSHTNRSLPNLFGSRFPTLFQAENLRPTGPYQ